MKRGTLCWVNLEPVSPPEPGKTRPAIIVSNSDQNVFLRSVVVVPISLQPGEIWPLRLRLEMPQAKASFAVLPGIRQVSKDRIQEIMGIVRPGDLERITEALSYYLND
jgi:mRNA-degrading endonuclease toxin of MazEF toxin-antitoxin module